MFNKKPNYTIEELEAISGKLRATCIKLSHEGREGHLNGALSSMDLIVALYYTWLNIPADYTASKLRDRFIFSKGHAVTSLYTVLADLGLIPLEYLCEYARNNSPLPSHPCKHSLPLLDASSGSLGHGLGIASGMAYSLKLDKNPARAVAFLSDGECNEGSTWEAAMFASANKLDNLLAVIDYNGTQAVAQTDRVTGGTSFEEKFRAFGWEAVTIDGHDFKEILDALKKIPFTLNKPSAIIAKTVAGKGAKFMENQVLWHYRIPPVEEVEKAIAEIGYQPIY